MHQFVPMMEGLQKTEEKAEKKKSVPGTQQINKK